VQRVGLLLIYLIGTLVMLNGRVCGVKSDHIKFRRRLCMSRSRSKSLPAIVFTIEFIALDNAPSIQLLGSVSLVQACWITSCHASIRLGPPFFNILAAIESVPAALLFFRHFSDPSISSRLSKKMSTPSFYKSTGRVGCSGAFVQVFFKMFFPFRQHVVVVVIQAYL
jgi:hypothetical protein